VAVGLAAAPRTSAAADLARVRQLQARGEWAAAESLATAALVDLGRAPAPDSLALAEASYLAGVAHLRRSGYADGQALAAGQRALGIRERALGPAHPAVAEAEMLIGRAFQGTGRTDSALTHLRRALDIRAAALAPDDTLLAESWDQIALAQRDRREFRDALDAWDQAIAVRTRRDGVDSAPVAMLRAQTGACWMELGDWTRARDVLEGALATYARIGAPDHPGRWVALNILADLENREGNLARRVDLLQEALRVVRASLGEDSRPALTLRINLAIALQHVGDFAGARGEYAALLAQAVQQYGPTAPRTLQLRFGLAAMNGALGDTLGAEREFAILDSLLATGASVVAGDAALATLQYADYMIGQRHYREALALCDRATARALGVRSPIGKHLARIQSERIRAWVGLGERAELDSARVGLDRIVARFGLASSGYAAEWRYYQAFGDEALGRRDSAWTEALEADRLAHENALMNLRCLSSRTGLQYSRTSLEVLDQVLKLAQGDPRRTAIAWDRLVLARGLLRTELACRAVPGGFQSDSGVTGAHARWQDGEYRYARALVGAGVGDTASRSMIEGARRQADECERTYAAVLSARRAGGPPGEVGLAAVRQALRPGEALVAFATLGGTRDSARVIAFVARGGEPGVAYLELGRLAALRDLTDRWRSALATPPSAAAAAARAERRCRDLGAAVARRLWDPIADRIGDARTAFLVADGWLAAVPWAALPAGANAYLVERDPRICVLECERDLVDAGAVHATGRMLAVGSPDFASSARSSPASAPLAGLVVRSAPDPCLDSRPLALKALPGSGDEARAVAEAWRAAGAGPATILEGQAATEAAFKAQAPACTVIHLATHGVMGGDRCAASPPGSRGLGGFGVLAEFAPRPHQGGESTATPPAPRLAPSPSPWVERRVWLALAGANRAGLDEADNDEGLLTAEEVGTLDLARTDWVVLSACHSGADDAWTSDGRYGMQRAFRIAGARSVIASLWAVDDSATGEWMAELYRVRLAGETDASLAVRDASLAVLAQRRASRRPTHPFYWAGFMAIGR
jgi:CHAT domain-containing protein/tetratricopeptide (TPR) repeat protein